MIPTLFLLCAPCLVKQYPLVPEFRATGHGHQTGRIPRPKTPKGFKFPKTHPKLYDYTPHTNVNA